MVILCVFVSMCAHMLFLVFMGLRALLLKQRSASSICRSHVVQLNWLIPLSVTECDWHSDAPGQGGLWE